MSSAWSSGFCFEVDDGDAGSETCSAGVRHRLVGEAGQLPVLPWPLLKLVLWRLVLTPQASSIRIRHYADVCKLSTRPRSCWFRAKPHIYSPGS